MFWETPQFIVDQIQIDGITQRVMTSPQSGLAIQSHYVLEGAASWRNYRYTTGKRRFHAANLSIYLKERLDNDTASIIIMVHFWYIESAKRSLCRRV